MVEERDGLNMNHCCTRAERASVQRIDLDGKDKTRPLDFIIPGTYSGSYLFSRSGLITASSTNAILLSFPGKVF